MVWAASLAGQGYGLSSSLESECEFGEDVEGGYVLVGCAMQLKPDYVMTAGDIVYADNAIMKSQEISEENGGKCTPYGPSTLAEVQSDAKAQCTVESKKMVDLSVEI